MMNVVSFSLVQLNLIHYNNLVFLNTQEVIEGTRFHETFHSPKIVGLEKPEKAQTPYSDKRCLNSVFSSTARSVGQQIKYTHLAEGFTIPTIKKAFDPNCPSGYVFSSAPYSELPKQKLIFLPLYYAYTVIHLNKEIVR